MGVRIDDNLGKLVSRDHGIDGFGYFISDEFRTSRVAIQCKRYTDSAVSEPDIDKFKGTMDSFNAEYGIFITTTHFTESAINKSLQGRNTPVTLIDGRKIADLVERYQLHITPVQTYTLDDYYFQKH
jgi:restriction system protein